MKQYRKQFKSYLDDLSKKKPAPGGGSSVCLLFCMGVSLIEKSVRYSLPSPKKELSLRSCMFNLDYLKQLQQLRKKVYPYIDLDGVLFERILKSYGDKKKISLDKSEELIIDLGHCCEQVFFLAKRGESGIKKTIVSDFHIGLNMVRIAFQACILNLEANEKMFKRKSKYIDVFKKYLKKIPF